MLKRFVIGLFALAILGTAVYLAGGFGVVIKKERSQVAAQQQKQKPKEVKQVKMGEKINIGGVDVIVDFSRARKVGLFGDGEPLNDTFVYVDILFENNKDELFQVNLLNRLKLVDASGKHYSVAIKPSIKKRKNNQPQESMKQQIRGKVAFDVMLSDSYELIYDDPKTNTRYVCKLDVADLPKKKKSQDQTGQMDSQNISDQEQ
ncbi:DUF4352 domain-containing protein [Thermoflavimicrobium dichotomicum]|uniref:DUF4352 domain-containing protein n=1 Tax=Thermoflavimicrobium dichotomicum TaxID=46223 RepID=A0A1I3N6E1_9BACL|nr:DUF4352 domain-containing protein [Thermoflavimicrobium dichotomicum]SFJ04777.1 protein of unknown function [Thermoflavimicrobium dichotomicum]